MVERSAFELHTIVGERFQERHQSGLIGGAQPDASNPRTQISALREIRVATVEVHDLFECCLSTVVEVWTGQLDIAQAGSLERALHLSRACGDEKRLAEAVRAGESGIICKRSDAGAKESEILRIVGLSIGPQHGRERACRQ